MDGGDSTSCMQQLPPTYTHTSTGPAQFDCSFFPPNPPEFLDLTRSGILPHTSVERDFGTEVRKFIIKTSMYVAVEPNTA